jgi:anti-sigma regulatory factor (Ser/Thr protein kinase)
MSSRNNQRKVRVVCKDFTARHLRRLRQLVLRMAHRAGLDSHRTGQLVLAVNEAASNAIEHAGGAGRLEIVQDDDRALIAEITDHGPGLPTEVSLSLPAPESTGGRGLWLIREVCDHVQLRTGRTGTTVRIEMAIGGR